MTPTATDEIVIFPDLFSGDSSMFVDEWRYIELDFSPAFARAKATLELSVRSLDQPIPADPAEREKLVEELIAWATDPDAFEPGAVDQIRRDAWGDAGA